MAKKLTGKRIYSTSDADNAKDKLFDLIGKWHNDNSKWENLISLFEYAEKKDKGGLRGIKSKIKRLKVNERSLKNMIKGNKDAKLPYDGYEKDLEVVKKQIQEFEGRIKGN